MPNVTEKNFHRRSLDGATVCCFYRVGITLQHKSKFGNEKTQDFRRVGENADQILSRLWTKVRDISSDVGDPL